MTLTSLSEVISWGRARPPYPAPARSGGTPPTTSPYTAWCNGSASSQRLELAWQKTGLMMGAGRAQELAPGQSVPLVGAQVGVQSDGSVNLQLPTGAFRFDAAGLCADRNGAAGYRMHLEGRIDPGQIRIEGGQVRLPSGQRVPFNNTGVIVRLADGSQVAVGRNSDQDGRHNRWATAGPGQSIPTSPPGRTTVYQLDEAGQVVGQSLQ